MGLNDIILTPHLLADLYKDVLIETNTTVVPEKAPIRFLGKNERNILIIVNKDDIAFLTDEELTFLTTVLSACGLSLADVAIVNWNTVPAMNCNAIYEEVNDKQVILFDLDPHDFGLPMKFPHFQIQRYDQRVYLYAPPLPEIMNNVELKKQLWAALRTFFSL